MRQRLPDRRPSVTERVAVTLDGGKDTYVIVTVGFEDMEMKKPREVFCADFKAGTSLHAIVMDACILLSRLLQHGDTPQELASSLCQPHSLVGTIAAHVVRLCEPGIHVHEIAPAPDTTAMIFWLKNRKSRQQSPSSAATSSFMPNSSDDVIDDTPLIEFEWGPGTIDAWSTIPGGATMVRKMSAEELIVILERLVMRVKMGQAKVFRADSFISDDEDGLMIRYEAEKEIN